MSGHGDTLAGEARDDLYRLANLLRELDRVLNPLDDERPGDYRVEPNPPPALPPTEKEAGTGPEGARRRSSAGAAFLDGGGRVLEQRPPVGMMAPWVEPPLSSVQAPVRGSSVPIATSGEQDDPPGADFVASGKTGSTLVPANSQRFPVPATRHEKPLIYGRFKARPSAIAAPGRAGSPVPKRTVTSLSEPGSATTAKRKPAMGPVSPPVSSPRSPEGLTAPRLPRKRGNRDPAVVFRPPSAPNVKGEDRSKTALTGHRQRTAVSQALPTETPFPASGEAVAPVSKLPPPGAVRPFPPPQDTASIVFPPPDADGLKFDKVMPTEVAVWSREPPEPTASAFTTAIREPRSSPDSLIGGKLRPGTPDLPGLPIDLRIGPPPTVSGVATESLDEVECLDADDEWSVLPPEVPATRVLWRNGRRLGAVSENDLRRLELGLRRRFLDRFTGRL